MVAGLGQSAVTEREDGLKVVRWEDVRDGSAADASPLRANAKSGRHSRSLRTDTSFDST
jgi:hypothetical protein